MISRWSKPVCRLSTQSRVFSTVKWQRDNRNNNKQSKAYKTESENEVLIEKITSLALNDKKNPLGTMNDRRFENVYRVVIEWIEKGDFRTADRLIKRMGYELASGSPIASRWQSLVMQLHSQLAEAYLMRGNPETGAQSAVEMLKQIVLWYEIGVAKDLPLHDVDIVIKSLLKQRKYDHALNLLIYWTDNFPSEQALITSLFELVIQAGFDTDNEEIMSKATNQLKMLEKDHAWSGINDIIYGKSKPLIELKKGNASIDSSSQKAEGRDISDGVVTLKAKTIKLLRKATKRDIEKVNEYQAKLLLFEQFELTSDVCESLLNYYIRVGSPKSASIWLQRLDQTGYAQIFEKVSEVIKLIGNHLDDDLPWRAAELFKRAEQLEREGKGVISTEMYFYYCKAWSQIDNAFAKRKIQEILSGFMITSNGGNIEKSPDQDIMNMITKHMLNSEKDIRKVLSYLASNWKRFNKVIMKETIGVTLPQLVNLGMSSEAESLLMLCKRSEVEIDQEALGAFIWEKYKVCDSTSLLIFLDFLKKLNTKVPLTCYSEVVHNALTLNPGNVIDKQNTLIGFVLHELVQSTFPATQEEIQSFLEFLTNTYLNLGRIHDAENVLLYFESNQASDQRANYLTSMCFNHVMKGWLDAGEYERVESIFERLETYGKSRHNLFSHDRISYSLYLGALSKRSNSSDQAERILQNLLDKYENESSDASNLQICDFDSALIALRNESPPDVIERSVKVLEAMRSYGILFDSHSFEIVMNSILESRCHEKLFKILELLTSMKEIGLNAGNETIVIILKACINHAEEHESTFAVETARQLLKDVRQSGVPVDSLTYMLYLTILRKGLKAKSQDDIQIITEALDFCREDGAMTNKLNASFKSLLKSLSTAPSNDDRI